MRLLKYGIEYMQGITAPYIDWVAGGNFDGFLVQKSLTFIEHGNTVELKTKVIDKTKYDGNVEDSIIIGTYKYTDKDTLTLIFEHFEMRGKILGENDEIIAFSVWSKTMNKTEVYYVQ